jgi:hypothetical protein
LIFASGLLRNAGGPAVFRHTNTEELVQGETPLSRLFFTSLLVGQTKSTLCPLCPIALHAKDLPLPTYSVLIITRLCFSKRSLSSEVDHSFCARSSCEVRFFTNMSTDSMTLTSSKNQVFNFADPPGTDALSKVGSSRVFASSCAVTTKPADSPRKPGCQRRQAGPMFASACGCALAQGAP